jgi:RNA polymerase primary sigma factor
MSMMGIRVADLEVLPDTLVERYQKSYKKGRRHFLDKIVLHNMKLVIHLAHKYYPPAGYSHEDLVMSGTFGLYSAARRWKRVKGVSFGTYASYHIRAHMRRFIQKNTHPVNVPYRFNDSISAAHREKRALEGRLGHAVSADDDRLSKQAQRTFSRATTRVELDGAVNDDGEPVTMDIPEQVEVPRYSEEEFKIMNRLLDQLPERIRIILRARFGFEDPEHIPTLEEMGARMRVTRERIRQLECNGISKLRRLLHIYKQKYNLVF